jgi:hypothetical protein
MIMDMLKLEINRENKRTRENKTEKVDDRET